MTLNEKLKIKARQLFTADNYRLLQELVYVDFKVYDRNSVLGIFWSLLNPAITLLVMYGVFERRFGHGVEFYPLYLLIGVVMVNYFITATTKMLRSLSLNRDIILNSMIPREDFVLADLLINTYKFIIELTFCCLLSLFYGALPWTYLPLIIPLFVAYIGFVLGVGFIISLLHCFAMDIEHVWTIASRLFLFITPVFYSLDRITPFFSTLIYWFNPLTPFLLSLRQIILGTESLHVANYIYSLAWGGGFFLFGYFLFLIFENSAVERA